MTMEDFRVKLLYTAVVYFLFLQLALRYGICGPTLSDLKENLGVDTDNVSKSVSVMCLGICIGAISSGFLCKLLSRELLTFILVLATSLFEATMPFIPNYGLFLVWNLFVGITSGASISLCESWILEIWGNQCAAYMQALQFFRGIGYIVAPILADPFLSSKEEIDEEIYNESNSTLNNETTILPHNHTHTLAHQPNYNSKIRTPYILNAAMLALGAIFLLCLYIFKKVRENRAKSLPKGLSQMEIISNSVNSISDFEAKDVQSIMVQDKKGEGQSVVVNQRVKWFGLTIVTISSIFYLFFYEEIVVIFLPIFATHLDVKLTKSQASLLTTAFSLANIIGKAIGVLLALKISFFTILYINLSTMIGSLVLIILFGNTHTLILWVGVCIHGVGLSSVIASLYTLMESTIEMSPLICGILNMMGTFGSVLVPLVVSGSLDKFPMILMYACLVCALVCLTLYITMHCLLRNKNALIAVPVIEKQASFRSSQKKISP